MPCSHWNIATRSISIFIYVGWYQLIWKLSSTKFSGNLEICNNIVWPAERAPTPLCTVCITAEQTDYRVQRWFGECLFGYSYTTFYLSIVYFFFINSNFYSLFSFKRFYSSFFSPAINVNFNEATVGTCGRGRKSCPLSKICCKTAMSETVGWRSDASHPKTTTLIWKPHLLCDTTCVCCWVTPDRRYSAWRCGCQAARKTVRKPGKDVQAVRKAWFSYI